YGVGSAIKGHPKYGGVWKPKIHSSYTSVCETNEHNTSQTCVFCFKKTTYPMSVSLKNNKTIMKTINGTSVCSNNNRVSVKLDCSHKSRDSVSALAIGISGLTSLIFGLPLPPFNPKKISHSNTDQINNAVTSFFKRNNDRRIIDYGNTF
ncbi:hypothetical protein EDC94DRAFT_526688, partial [Helicostylum pulchrum]